MTDRTATPEPLIAWVVSITPNPDNPAAALLKVACPICHGWHSHGDPEASPDRTEFGHRGSHCLDLRARDDYLLKLAPPDLAVQLTADRAQCTATTAKGTRCTRKALPSLGAAQCRQHKVWVGSY